MKAADIEGAVDTRAGCSDGVTVGTVERPGRELGDLHHYLRGSPAGRITTRKTSFEARGRAELLPENAYFTPSRVHVVTAVRRRARCGCTIGHHARELLSGSSPIPCA